MISSVLAFHYYFLTLTGVRFDSWFVYPPPPAPNFCPRRPAPAAVPKWLHKLRLHKYTWIFAGMTYEDLFDVTMEKLLSLGVTQGGANKLRELEQVRCGRAIGSLAEGD